jgi:hypothetical protein
MVLNAYERAFSRYFHSLVAPVVFTRGIHIFADFYFLFSVVYFDFEVWGIELTEFFKGRNAVSCFAESLVDLPTGQTLIKYITSDLPPWNFGSNYVQNCGSRGRIQRKTWCM